MFLFFRDDFPSLLDILIKEVWIRKTKQLSIPAFNLIHEKQFDKLIRHYKEKRLKIFCEILSLA